MVREDFLDGGAVCDDVAVEEEFGEDWGWGVEGGDGVSGGLQGGVERLDEGCGGCIFFEGVRCGKMGYVDSLIL